MNAVSATNLYRLTRAPEAELVQSLLLEAQSGSEDPRLRESLLAAAESGPKGPVAPLLAAFGLNTPAGQALMSLAEAFLRVPDDATADALIASKLAQADWRDYGAAGPVWVKLVARALGLSRTLTEGNRYRWSRPLIRAGVARAMQQMGRFFVLGRTIEEAMSRAARMRPDVCSFDMLGEGARTAEAAERYHTLYADTIDAVSRAADPALPLMERHGVSVKLSALHPRYEEAQAFRCVPELIERLTGLAERAAAGGIGLTVDAEEVDRLEMSLDIIGAVARDPKLAGWDGLGMAVQAYQKRATAVIDWGQDTAAAAGRKLAVRLVKGAYWDSEIRRCQLDGLEDYPIFTRKPATDVSYLACARRMLERPNLQSAFATHNALTVSTLMSWIGARRDVEFQRLHGMGEPLYRELRRTRDVRVRVYAPVGGYEDLLPYLVRRLLENGANTSFVNLAARASEPEDPRILTARNGGAPHARIAPPPLMFGAQRRNSMGMDMADRRQLASIRQQISHDTPERPRAAPLIGGKAQPGAARVIANPATGVAIGEVIEATEAQAAEAVAIAAAFAASWNDTAVGERAACLERAGDALERERLSLIALLVREAGKTQADALAEVREAADFCRYYAAQARALMGETALPGPTGESNSLRLSGRGVFVCISPWNFPLAIFTGQLAAALATGNCAVAKPAPQTPLIAAKAVEILLAAGVPPQALQLLPGGTEVGRALVTDTRVSGVVFTGSTMAAKHIARSLVADDARPLVPLIAETGGLNAMIVDSTALPEQVVRDVIASAFQSAGQRCSALRLLCLQDEIAAEVLAMLQGAVAQLCVGDPETIQNDVGPVIDAEAKRRIDEYVTANESKILFRFDGTIPQAGYFVRPVAIGLARAEELDREVFGPVLHVVRWKAGALDGLVSSINARGYGLTMGIHSRIPDAIARICARAHVGNIYVNRSMIGAVVGVQPFGGEGLSGTGPKAGGPHYLLRFCVERTVSTDLTAIGGNTQLLGLASE